MTCLLFFKKYYISCQTGYNSEERYWYRCGGGNESGERVLDLAVSPPKNGRLLLHPIIVVKSYINRHCRQVVVVSIEHKSIAPLSSATTRSLVDS